MQELSLHILDLVQNSLTAGANDIRISVLENTIEDKFEITIADNGKGMDQTSVSLASDPFFTSRTTREVGLGLPFMKMMSSFCDGEFSLNSKKGEGTTVKASFRHSHIDRLPLGDMASTIMTLVGANEPVEFTFSHRRNENEFTFSTKELRQELEGLPLDHFEVLTYIKNFIENKTNMLYGGKHI